MPKTTRKTPAKKKPAAKIKTRAVASRPTRKRAITTKARTSKQRKGLVHHSKRLYRATPKFIHGMVVGAVIGIIVVSQLGTSSNASALTIAAGKDCDSYSIINCGVTSTANLKNDYANSAYVRHVYKHFLISSGDMDNIGSTAVQGTVFRSGQIKVNGKVVATGVLTAARQRVTSKDAQVTVDGSTFYVRTIASSWSHDSAPAYVVMKSGVVQFAILAPCGNPVIPPAVAVPVPPTTTKPSPPPTTPTPPTKPPIKLPPSTPPKKPPKSTPPSPIPTSPPKKTTIVQAASITSLPDTGPGAVLVVFAISLVCGTLFHKTHHHIKKRKLAKHYAH